MKEAIPNPGSPEAIKQGCLCPVKDNSNGSGRIIVIGKESSLQFFVEGNCPLHSIWRSMIKENHIDEGV